MHGMQLGKGVRHEPSVVGRSTFFPSEVPHFVVPASSMLPTVHRRLAIGDRNPCLRQLIACASHPRLLSKSWTRTPRQMKVSIHRDRPVTPLAYRSRRTTATGVPHMHSTDPCAARVPPAGVHATLGVPAARARAGYQIKSFRMWATPWPDVNGDR